MKYLLDTRIILWWLQGAEDLKPEISGKIAFPSNDIAVSAVSAWEIMTKSALGRTDLTSSDFAFALQASGFTQLSLNHEHVLQAAALPRHHVDPFDRLLIAQDQVEQRTLIAEDRRFEAYDINVVWA